MSKPYYTLAVLEHGTWSPQFGDYARSVVADERDDWESADEDAITKIVTSDDTQAGINAAIERLNNAQANRS